MASTLGEGSTPLIRSERLSKLLDVELYFKFEGMNPTGSFKDRGMAVAVAANAIDDESTVRGWQAVGSSYPEFHEHLAQVTQK